MNLPERVVYIAGPFRHESEWGRRENTRQALLVGLAVARLGGAPFIPHANTGALYGELPETFFLEADLLFLRFSQALVTVPGWQNSLGASAEVDYARKLLIHVFHFPWDYEEATELIRDEREKITIGEFLHATS